MEWFAILIPILSIPIMRVFFPHRVVWWELFLPVLPVLIIVPTVKIAAESSQTRDYERWGGWTTEVRYYEDWDEWITRTCYRQVPCGTDSKGNTKYCTESYDCSYRQYHPEYWESRGSNGEAINISQSWYNILVGRFGNKKFVDLHRHYYHDDGDMYSSVWPKKDDTLTPLFTEHSYENRVQANKGVFAFPEVSDKTALFEYPEFKNHFNDPAILGKFPGKESADKLLQFYNAKLGAKHQIRYWILLFHNQPRSKGLDQESLWKGGNKNEFTVCIGLDGDKPTWCHAFCWSPDGYAGNDEMRINVRDFVEQQKTLDLSQTIYFMADQTPQYWKRKSFKEFSYLEVEIPTWGVVVIYILTILMTAGVCAFAVMNEVDDDPADEQNLRDIKTRISLRISNLGKAFKSRFRKIR